MGSYGLEVVRVTSNGRRYYDPAGKARLVEACLEPGISVARLALEHGLNEYRDNMFESCASIRMRM